MPALEALELPSFFQNLSQRISPKEVDSLHILGDDFFELVDLFSQELYNSCQQDLLLLEMEADVFHWELQVFANQFIRQSCGSPLRLRPFCRQLRQQLENPAFAQELSETLKQSYQEHFYQLPAPQLLV